MAFKPSTTEAGCIVRRMAGGIDFGYVEPIGYPQLHTLHSERDDAWDALIAVTAQLEEARTAEAAAESQIENLRAELERLETQTGGELYTARKWYPEARGNV